jgi:hypothetical protein
MAEGPSIVIAKVTGQSAVNWRFEVGSLVVEGRAFSATDDFPPYPDPGSTITKLIDV